MTKYPLPPVVATISWPSSSWKWQYKTIRQSQYSSPLWREAM